MLSEENFIPYQIKKLVQGETSHGKSYTGGRCYCAMI